MSRSTTTLLPAVAPLASPAVDPTAPRVTAPDDRVPVPEKCAYGLAGSVTIFEGHLPKNLATPVFVVMLGMSPTAVSVAMLVFRLYDAFLSPVVGWMSDNTRTRWGRRRPWMFVGAILTGLWLPVMWLVGADWSSRAHLAWFIGTGLVLYTVATVFATPYESLNLELTPDYDERTSVNSYKALFQKFAGLVVGWAWYITLLPLFNGVDGKPNVLRGAIGLSAIVGAAVIVLGVLPAILVRERFYKVAHAQARVSLADSFRYTLSNRPFLILTAASVLFITATYLANGISFYLRLYYAAGGDERLSAKIGGAEATLVMIVGIAAIPVFARVARTFGKTTALRVAMGGTMLACLSNWFTYDPRWPWLSIAGQVLLAPSTTGLWQMIPSMTGDVCDLDELRTGERREGAFASIYSWIVKASFTAGIALSGPVVELCGFSVPLGAAQAPATLHAMRFAIAVVPAALLGVGMLVLMRYPLTPARMLEVRAELEARRGRI